MMMQALFPAIVYLLCFATSAACFWLLLTGWRRTRARLLLWSSLCFFFLAANNLLVVLDLLVLKDVDMRLERLLLSLAAASILLFGFIWSLEEE
jgi:hypothetical protein